MRGYAFNDPMVTDTAPSSSNRTFHGSSVPIAKSSIAGWASSPLRPELNRRIRVARLPSIPAEAVTPAIEMCKGSLIGQNISGCRGLA